MRKKATLKGHLGNFLIIVSIVLMWRGIWLLLDMLDEAVFGGSHLSTAIIGIISGMVIIYLMDWELEDII